MDKNFSITDAVSIQVGNVNYDLHNDFDLTSFEVNYSRKSLQLTFTLSKESATLNQPLSLALIFSDVAYLLVSNRIFGDMVCDIVEIGYKSPDDHDYDWLIRESQASPSDHLFLRLSGDEFIRVYSRSVLAQIMHLC